jgi:hypothetical protein
MPITLNGTAGVTFPDSVLQPNGVPAPGTSSNVLTSNGTAWTSAALGAPTTAQVLTATAGSSAGAVGTYGILRQSSGSTVAQGSTLSGSLVWSDCGDNSSGVSPSGTWMSMGQNRNGFGGLWLRIA